MNAKPILIMLAALGTALATPATAADKMTLTLNFLAQPAQAGFFLAKKRGYYDQAGIDLTIVEGKGSATTAQMIAGGQTDIGFVGGTVAIDLISKGAPMVIVSDIIQGNFQSIVHYADDGINSAKDLVGKTVSTCPGCVQIPMLHAALARAGVDASKVNITNTNSTAWIGLLSEKKVDGIVADPNTVTIEMRRKGHKVKDLFFQDMGISPINFVLATRTDKLKANPDLYKRFIEASLKGWSELGSSPDEAIDALVQQYPSITVDKETLKAQLQEAITPFVCVGGAAGVGRAPDSAREDTYKLMKDFMNLKTEKPITAFYTEEYLPAKLPACPK
jgi:NitT/TauT family transport system substrate-binding protein